MNTLETRVDALEKAIFMIAAAVHEAALLALRDMAGDAGNDDGGEEMEPAPAPAAAAAEESGAASTADESSAVAPAPEHAPEPAPVAAAAPAPAPAPEKPHPATEYTYDQVAAILTEHFNALGAGRTSSVLAQFNATRLTELVPSQYPALVDALKQSMEENAGEDENAFL